MYAVPPSLRKSAAPKQCVDQIWATKERIRELHAAGELVEIVDGEPVPVRGTPDVATLRALAAVYASTTTLIPVVVRTPDGVAVVRLPPLALTPTNQPLTGVRAHVADALFRVAAALRTLARRVRGAS